MASEHEQPSRTTASEALPLFAPSTAVITAVFSILLFIPLGWVVFTHGQQTPDLSTYSSQFNPPVSELVFESAEKYTYMAACVFFPASILGLTLLLGSRPRGQVTRSRVLFVGAVLLCGLGVYLFLKFDQLKLSEVTQYAAGTAHPFALALFVAILGMSLTGRVSATLGPKASTRLYWAGLGLVGLYALAGSAVRTLPDRHPYVGGFHFSAVFTSMVYVFQGQVLLKDILNTYGLYPHFLHPLFAITGLTPKTFTITLAALTFLSVACLGYFLDRTLTSPGTKLLGMFAVVDACCLFRPLPVSDEPYFQYVPIRLLFPSLLLAASTFYFRHPTRRTSLGILALVSVAILWNTDTGVICFLAWQATLWFSELGRDGGLKALFVRCLSHALTSAGVLTLVLALYWVAIWLFDGRGPDYSNLAAVQQIFYRYGYAMAKMPLFHAWMLYALVCIIGLAYSAAEVVRGRLPRSTLSLFLVTMLSIGSFSYYQGRSVTSNLVGPLYLVVLVLILLADRLLEELRRTAQASSARALLSVFFMFALFPVAALSFDALVKPEPVAREWSRTWNALVAESRRPETPEYASLTRFVRPGEPLLVLSYAAGVIHLATRTPPAAFDSFAELFLKSDYRALLDVLRRRTSRVIVVERSLPSPDAAEMFAIVDQNYHQIGSSPHGQYQVLERNEEGR